MNLLQQRPSAEVAAPASPSAHVDMCEGVYRYGSMCIKDEQAQAGDEDDVRGQRTSRSL